MQWSSDFYTFHPGLREDVWRMGRGQLIDCAVCFLLSDRIKIHLVSLKRQEADWATTAAIIKKSNTAAVLVASFGQFVMGQEIEIAEQYYK